jgi:hypothetical protein
MGGQDESLRYRKERSKGFPGIMGYVQPGQTIRTAANATDGLLTIYRAEGTRGLYKGSLLALVGVSNGSIQFATYEEIKRRRTDIKRKLFAKQGREWKIEDEKLVS